MSELSSEAPDPDAAGVLDRLIRERRSVRAFRAEMPSEAQLRAVLEAAIHAPSAGNKQPWRFLIVRERARIEAMAQATREAIDTLAASIPRASEPSFRRYGDYFMRFEAAPVVIVPIHRGQRVLSHLLSPRLEPEARREVDRMERDSGLLGAGLAVQNLLLAAHAHGLGASVMTGPLIAASRHREILDVPTSWGIVALIPLGIPAEIPSSPGRKALSKVVRWL